MGSEIVRYTAKETDLSALQLNEADNVRSALQNIAIILRTGQKTAPLYRDFGLSQSIVDRPTPIAKPLIIAAIKDAIETYEPRATVENVTFTEDANNPGRLIPTVEVTIIDG